MKRRLLAVFLVIPSCFVLAGCDTDILPDRTEIEQFEVMEVFGIDQSREDPSQVEVTYLSERAAAAQSEKGASSEKSFPIISSKASTIFEAERKVKAHSDKKPYFGYVEYILIGEDAAKDDFSKYFDFTMRDHEIRFTPKVYIVKDCTAKELISTTTSSTRYLGDRLANIDADISDMSNYGKVNVVDVAAMLNDKNASVVIPVLTCSNIKDEKHINGQLPEKDAVTSGYAVINGFKLVGFIDESCSRGYNFLVGKVHSSAISVQDPNGMNVALEVINEKTRVVAHFDGDSLEGVTFKTHVYSNIVEQQSRDDIYTPDSIDEICAKQSDVIKSEMEQVISLSKEFKTDCIGLGERIRMSHPYKWEKIKDTWNDVYPSLNIDVLVESDIRRAYDLHEPNGYQMGRDA